MPPDTPSRSRRPSTGAGLTPRPQSGVTGTDFYTRLTKEVIGSPAIGPQGADEARAESPQTPGRLDGFAAAGPALSEAAVAALDKVVQDDPYDVLQVLPEALALVERYIVAQPDQCGRVWDAMRAALRDVLQPAAGPAPAAAAGRNRGPRTAAVPSAPARPKSWTNAHKERWTDDFAWLTDRDDPAVLEYIASENRYAERQLRHGKPLQRLLYREFVGRFDENEASARVTLPDGWTYFARTLEGQEYRQHVRVRSRGPDLGQGEEEEDVYLDENVWVQRPEFVDASVFHIGFLRHSDDGRRLALGIDTMGNERYTAYFMDMDTKEVLADRLTDVYEGFEWSADGTAVYYLRLDDCERAYQLVRHRIGSNFAEDEVLYTEVDEAFFLSLQKAGSGRLLVLQAAAQVTSETRVLSAEDADATLALVLPRREGVAYTAQAHEEHLYVLTNEGAKNNWIFRVSLKQAMEAAAGSAKAFWPWLEGARETVVEARDFVMIEDFVLQQHHLAVVERSNCHQNVRVVDLRHAPRFGNYHYISFADAVYALWPGAVDAETANLERMASWRQTRLRFTFTSLVQPKQIVDYDMDARTMHIVREEAVGNPDGSEYDASLYAQRRLYVTGIDGTTIPLSLVFRRDLLAMNLPGREAAVPRRSAGGGAAAGATFVPANACLLHSYGAYGASMNAIFSHARLSLLDRGFIFAIAHVRGGADMGTAWYEEGKLAKKPNSFLDFISCAEFLCKEGYTTRHQLAAYGRSAGGLLVAAAVTMRPDLFRAALLEVPFVDVVNTMFNPAIPWTAYEYEEWGNPADPDIYDVMKSYCPYTQLARLGPAMARGEFPDLFVLGGMNDPRVAFFEPLKFVAKMRHVKARALRLGAGAGPLGAPGARDPGAQVLLRVADGGHGGSPGQYAHLDELAAEYAFLIDRVAAPLKPIPPDLIAQTGPAILYGPAVALALQSAPAVRAWSLPLSDSRRSGGVSGVVGGPMGASGDHGGLGGEANGDGVGDDEDDEEEDDAEMVAIRRKGSAMSRLKGASRGLRRMLSSSGGSLGRRPDAPPRDQKSLDPLGRVQRARGRSRIQDWVRDLF